MPDPLYDDTNALASKLLGAVVQGQHCLRIETLKSLEGTVSTVLSVLRNGINNHTPINALPVEVLCMVFQHTLPSEDGDIRHSGCKDPRPSNHLRARLALTSVCQRWRQIATDMASLWTVVDIPGPSSSVFAARSRDMPLQVFASYSPDQRIGDALVRHASRIRDVAVNVPITLRSSIPSPGPMFAFNAPQLEFLSVTTCCRPFEESRPTLDFDAPSVLFPGKTPNLRMLVLNNTCWVPAVPCSNLTHLHLEKGPPTPLIPLLVFLERCPALTHLAIVDVYLSLASAIPFDHAIELPALRSLTLGINQAMLSMRRLLQYFILPTENVRLRVSGPYALRAMGGLHPFPSLPFVASFDRLLIEGGPGRLVVYASGPDEDGSALLLDFPEYRPSDQKQAVAVVQDMIMLEGIVEWTYRGPARFDGIATALVQAVRTPCAFRRFVYVDVPARWKGPTRAATPDPGSAARRAPSYVAEKVSSVEEIVVWSAQPDLLFNPGVQETSRSLRRLSFHCTNAASSEKLEAARMVQAPKTNVEVVVRRNSECDIPSALLADEASETDLFGW